MKSIFLLWQFIFLSLNIVTCTGWKTVLRRGYWRIQSFILLVCLDSWDKMLKQILLTISFWKGKIYLFLRSYVASFNSQLPASAFIWKQQWCWFLSWAFSLSGMSHSYIKNRFFFYLWVHSVAVDVDIFGFNAGCTMVQGATVTEGQNLWR